MKLVMAVTVGLADTVALTNMWSYSPTGDEEHEDQFEKMVLLEVSSRGLEYILEDKLNWDSSTEEEGEYRLDILYTPETEYDSEEWELTDVDFRG